MGSTKSNGRSKNDSVSSDNSHSGRRGNLYELRRIYSVVRKKKNALGRKPGYFNIVYRPEYDTKFYRAHLVGVIERIGNMMLCIVEIHPEDAAKARAWTVRKAELCGKQLLKKGRFYRYAFKEELYG